MALEMTAQLELGNRKVVRHVKLVTVHDAEHTLGELFRAMHMGKEAEWTRNHMLAQKRFRLFWLEQFGADTLLTQVTAHEVETRAKLRPGGTETRRKLLTYIRGAYAYAEKKLKWIDSRANLSNVALPKARGVSRAYSTTEVVKLISALEEIGPEAAWLGHVAWQSGRRLSAIRTLPKAAVETFGDYSVLTFPGETDKARLTGEVVVVGRAHELTVELSANVVSSLQHILGDPPPTEEKCIRIWLYQAEKLAGIEHVKGRGYHGIKRRFATATRGMVGRDKQSGTREETLESEYVQDDRDPKLAVAKALAEMVDGRS